MCNKLGVIKIEKETNLSRKSNIKNDLTTCVNKYKYRLIKVYNHVKVHNNINHQVYFIETLIILHNYHREFTKSVMFVISIWLYVGTIYVLSNWISRYLNFFKCYFHLKIDYIVTVMNSRSYRCNNTPICIVLSSLFSYNCLFSFTTFHTKYFCPVTSGWNGIFGRQHSLGFFKWQVNRIWLNWIFFKEFWQFTMAPNPKLFELQWTKSQFKWLYEFKLFYLSTIYHHAIV